MYIVFEGIDGSGKSTQLELVRERLELILREDGCDVDVVVLSEPELDSDVVVDEDDDVELALRFALQRRLVTYPLLDKLHSCNSCIVLSDRSFYSSFAYQDNGTFCSCEWLRVLNRFVPEPVMVFFFDKGVPDDLSLKYVYDNYYHVLPLHTIHVNTRNHSINDTTSFIAKKILLKWRKLFFNQNNKWEF